MNVNFIPPSDPRAKFSHPDITAKGETRAQVTFNTFKTVWLNTGSLCNIECANCYIQSSPKADHFVYLTPDDIGPYLDEIKAMGDKAIEIGITGGEPFLNPYILKICRMALEDGHKILLLTNAMKPMMRPHIKAGLLELKQDYPDQMTFRISLDHYTAAEHDKERGTGSFDKAITGLNWLSQHGFNIDIAGRSIFAEDEQIARAGYTQLAAQYGWKIDCQDPAALMLFPEMDVHADVPEITTACWDILKLNPDSLMCASSRMIVKRKGAANPAVLACTLLWDDPQFELGPTLENAQEPIKLNHPHCAKFCVLGGASCSA